jgi:hypothetical protein
VAVSKGRRVTGWVITAVVSLMFVFSAAMKFRGGPELAKGMEFLQLRPEMTLPLAALELACILVYLIPQTSVLGAILMTGYLGGAILTHWRIADVFVTHIVLGLLIWLGIYLREPRLAALLPVRRGEPAL